MEKKEILELCTKENILLDEDLLNIFSKINDLRIIHLILNQLKNFTKSKFITKELLGFNKEKLTTFFSSSSFKNESLALELIFKLGFNLEISSKINIQENSIFNNLNYPFYDIKNPSQFPCSGKTFEVKDFVNYFKGRFNEMKSILLENSSLDNVISINKISNPKSKICLIGMIYNKKITKNKHILLEIEDLSGKAKLIVSVNKPDLYKKAEDISLDSVLGFICSGNKDLLFVDEIIFPEANLHIKKKSPIEECALFIGDLHYGSKNFLKSDFLKFIEYLNERNENSETMKIKYLFIVGDLITGIGNYPDQEKDLEIKDLEEQFKNLASLLSKIRKDIKIIISPGNHDAVRLMEPQPLLDEKYAWPLYELNNVLIINNPSYINIASNDSFSGFDILVYHGFSYPYYANVIPSLIQERAMNSPEKIMKYLLINRHLAPAHSSTQYYPCERDSHIIRKIPDIFVSGHTHKSGISYHNNILLISVSSWESLTPYQEKFGNEPDHCKVPMVNLKTRVVKILDFEGSGGKDENRN